ncbi:Competence protein A [Rubripirellula tenax]|uniref:Competence protein A n=1 Tax=Rubripirellula tenax TaxID=2528015 RepID=A0A5C6F4D3_9BACT|nr:type IV pilus assembly protein PilM [Rubripirellula tenax]TWU56603.1 Competence protein A [Rubripirellula tenax]
MARSSSSVWGIEIGQTALKALRCSLVDGEPVADAFDFIEYPKILSQPEAVAEELIADALNQLLERNDAINEKVVISVPGQSGLAKFFKPPPVEVKKIADIVRYEARQQIPFDLADVVWDFQMMPGSMVEEGYALESEVGLFAMKREQAYRQMAPFDDVKIEVDQVQLAPLALYNMLAFDRMHERVDAGMFDPDDPPPSTVLLSIGTDSSDLIVTNGFRIWQRSMPIGGNHFTRQLTKDLKMTFAKAEHLKRNAREAVDPKLVFQTMRPVFNDLVTEVQRSIGFFRSIDKKAEIGELIITGNTVKMPGLAAYLGKNLGFDVHVLDRFNRLGGEDVLAIPTFRDNIPTFAVCYGLCLQGLGVSQIHASLVPQEILTQRMIRAKKPWTVAALATLMIGMTAHYAFTERSWATTHDDLWKAPQNEVQTMKSYADLQTGEDGDLNSKLTYLNEIGKEVSGDSEARLKWLEIIKVVNDAIPRVDFPDGKILSPKELPYLDRKDIHVQQFETKYYEDLSLWYTERVARRYRDEIRSWARITNNQEDPIVLNLAEDVGPTESGWVIQMNCYHYYNSPDRIGLEGSNHVRNILTTSFLKSSATLPIGVDAAGNAVLEKFTLPEMGLTYPLLLDDKKDQPIQIPNPDYDPEAIMAVQMRLTEGEEVTPEMEAVLKEPPVLQVRKLEFVYQIVWQEKVLSERLEAKEEARKAAEEEAAATAVEESVAVVP